jgi:hypothetical protein
MIALEELERTLRQEGHILLFSLIPLSSEIDSSKWRSMSLCMDSGWALVSLEAGQVGVVFASVLMGLILLD